MESPPPNANSPICPKLAVRSMSPCQIAIGRSPLWPDALLPNGRCLPGVGVHRTLDLGGAPKRRGNVEREVNRQTNDHRQMEKLHGEKKTCGEKDSDPVFSALSRRTHHVVQYA